MDTSTSTLNNIINGTQAPTYDLQLLTPIGRYQLIKEVLRKCPPLKYLEGFKPLSEVAKITPPVPTTIIHNSPETNDKTQGVYIIELTFTPHEAPWFQELQLDKRKKVDSSSYLILTREGKWILCNTVEYGSGITTFKKTASMTLIKKDQFTDLCDADPHLPLGIIDRISRIQAVTNKNKRERLTDLEHSEGEVRKILGRITR